MRPYVVCLLALSLSNLGCEDDPTGLANEVEVLTDESSYQGGEWVTITVRNDGDETVGILLCEGGLMIPEVQRRENGRWESISGLACAPPTFGTLHVEPGTTTAPIFVEVDGLDGPGTYRFGFLVFEDAESPEEEDLTTVFGGSIHVE